MNILINVPDANASLRGQELSRAGCATLRTWRCDCILPGAEPKSHRIGWSSFLATKYDQVRRSLTNIRLWHVRQSPTIWLDYAMIAAFFLAGIASVALPN
jgi:hypothetical protein